MSLNIGNQFTDGRSPITYGKVPLWDRVDEQYPSGVYVKKDETNTENKLIPAGTPVYVEHIGAEPLIGEKITDKEPTGLTRYDAVVGNNGCTLTVVTRGAIYVDRVAEGAKLTADLQGKLAGRILFIKETAGGDV